MTRAPTRCARAAETCLSRVSTVRDGYRLPPGPIANIEDLIGLIQRNNREFMAATRWVSPRILCRSARHLRAFDERSHAVDEEADGGGARMMDNAKLR
jgi:hypothetical protein